MPDAFYEPLGDGRFASTELTVGPWDVAAQHAGPPAALAGRAAELCPGTDPAEWAVTRVTCEILGPVPVAELDVTAAVVRGGRSVQLVEVTIAAAGRAVMLARAWRQRTAGLDLPAPASPPVPPLPDAGSELPPGWSGGYLAAVEWRLAEGGIGVPGPAMAWTRLRHPLVAGEAVSPLQRVLAVADSGSGVSSEVDIRKWLFVNTELTVHLHRHPAGEWVGLDAAMTVEPLGTGLATSRLWDRDGLLGRGAQALVIRSR
jgi:hypothetical protein